MSQVDLEQRPHRRSFSRSANGESCVCFFDADDGSCYSQFFSTNGGSYNEYNFAFVSDPQIGMVSDSRRASSVSNCSVEVVEIEIGVLKIKVHLDRVERDCRICHLGLESNNHEFGAPIELGCSCKDDLAAARGRRMGVGSDLAWAFGIGFGDMSRRFEPIPVTKSATDITSLEEVCGEGECRGEKAGRNRGMGGCAGRMGAGKRREGEGMGAPTTSRARLHHSTILSVLGPDHAITILFLETHPRTSQWVTHPGNALARTRLTSEFRWNPKPVSSQKASC
ncbi:hypothetical protein EV2_036228 [Malus domestica]